MSSPSQQYHAVGTRASGDNRLAMMHDAVYEDDDEDDEDDEDYEDDDLERDADGLSGTGDEDAGLGATRDARSGGSPSKKAGNGRKASNRPRSASNTYEVHRLDESKKMKQMDIMVTGDRMPTEVNHRRRVVIGLFALFAIILGAVVVAEVALHGAKDDLVTIMERDEARRDVFLIRFSVAGKRVTWTDAETVESIAMSRALVDRLGSIPFHDFSIEVYKQSLADPVEIAVVEEDNDKIDTDITCTNNAIQSFAKVPIKRCAPRTEVSALKEAVTCEGSTAGRMISFWQQLFKDLGEKEGINSRCCDHDQVADNVSNELELCRAPLAGSADPTAMVMFRYYTKPKDIKTCHKTMCGCECLSDAVCPSIPTELLKGNKICQVVADLKNGAPINCADLPIIARNYDAILKSNKIDIGTNPRCYGRTLQT